MKNILYLLILSGMVLTGLSGCYQTCTDPFAVNYTLKGSCIDLTTGITGAYIGQLKDSTTGTTEAFGNITILVTKMDDSHVTVTSGSSSFVAFNALVAQSQNGYYLTVASQTTNSIPVSGVGAGFGNPADGVYTSSNRQLILYVLAGPTYQIFSGTQQ